VANPQLKKGHTQIANELLEAYARYFPDSEARVMFAIIRKICGWHKKQDHISIGQLQAMTGLSRRAVIYAMQNLEAKKMINVVRKRGRGYRNVPNGIAIQENYNKWVVQRKSSQYRKNLKNQRKRYQKYKGKVVKKNQASAKSAQKGSANTLHPQKISTKEKGVVETSIKRCATCQTEFSPRESWHSLGDNCFTESKKPAECFMPEPCNLCQWPAYPGYKMEPGNLCKDCYEQNRKSSAGA